MRESDGGPSIGPKHGTPSTIEDPGLSERVFVSVVRIEVGATLI